MVSASVKRDFGLTQSEPNYYSVLDEANENEFEENKIACVGDGLGANHYWACAVVHTIGM